MKNQEYEKAEQEVYDKHNNKFRKIFKNSLMAMAISAVMGIASGGVYGYKYFTLDKNTPIYREYEANQNSLSYLKEKLNLSKNLLPKYLAPQISSGLEKLEAADSARVSALERAVKIAERDSSRIVNTQEAKEWSDKVENINSWGDLTKYLFGMVALVTFAMGNLIYFNDKKKKRELKSLKESYGIKE